MYVADSSADHSLSEQFGDALTVCYITSKYNFSAPLRLLFFFFSPVLHEAYFYFLLPRVRIACIVLPVLVPLLPCSTLSLFSSSVVLDPTTGC